MRKKISDYISAKVGADWMPSLAAAYGDLGAGGGTVEFDVNTELKTAINFNSSDNVSMRLMSDGSLINVNADGSVQLIRSSNQTDFLMEGLSIHGKTTAGNVCSFIALSNAFDRSRVNNCHIAGVRAASCLLYFYQTDARVNNSRFGGCAATSNIYVDGCSGFTLDHSHFYDYSQMAGVYYDHVGSDSWVKARNAPPSTSAFTPLFASHFCRFDEGAEKAMDIESYPDVKIEDFRINVNGTNEGIGLKIKNAKKVDIQRGWFGLGTVDNRRAVQLENVEFAEISDITLSHGVKKLEFLGSTKKVVLKNCWYDYNGIRRRLGIGDIINSANAEVHIDNIVYKNGKAAFV